MAKTGQEKLKVKGGGTYIIIKVLSDFCRKEARMNSILSAGNLVEFLNKKRYCVHGNVGLSSRSWRPEMQKQKRGSCANCQMPKKRNSHL